MVFPKVTTVSVVIASWNGAKYIIETLDSILNQSYPVCEIIVVDDGSSDNTRDLVENYNPLVRLVAQPNAGRCAARNNGIMQAVGDALIILDQDDLLLPNNVEVGVRMLNNNLHAAFSGGFSIGINENGDVTGDRFGSTGLCDYGTMLRGSMFVPPSVVMFRTKVLQEIGGFDTSFKRGGEDSDIYLRVAQNYPVHCHDIDVVAYRRHGENGSNDAEAMLTTSLQFMEKQRKFVDRHPQYKGDWQVGRVHWCRLFGKNLVMQGVGVLKAGDVPRAVKIFILSLRYHPKSFANFAAFHLRRILSG
ncbi:glycosyltransferase family 2 protein [Thioclava kandeliae]|uniref:Glycosyltransferase n=1 Tax=Thioclava kandeliae TaxID=3070818 RepID=A0ABV1SM99_9RHOB